MDLHQNNIMAYQNVTNNMYNMYNIFIQVENKTIYKSGINFLPFTYIIDFGRIEYIDLLDIRNISFEHLRTENKTKNDAGSYDNRLNDIKITTEMIKQIIKLLLFEEFKYYKINFNINYIQSLYIYEDFFNIKKTMKYLAETLREFSPTELINFDYNNLDLDFEFKKMNQGDTHSKNFDNFCKYVNDLIFYYFRLIEPIESAQEVVNDQTTKEIDPKEIELNLKNTLYDGETYVLQKKDLHLCTFKTPLLGAVMSEQGDADCTLKMRNGVNPTTKTRVKDRNGMILYDSVPEKTALNQSDLTTYVTTIPTRKYRINENNMPDDKEILIRKLRNALLTDNFDDITTELALVE